MLLAALSSLSVCLLAVFAWSGEVIPPTSRFFMSEQLEIAPSAAKEQARFHSHNDCEFESFL
jgi:hypothetical protein